MRRIIFERYQDECINLVLLKRDIEHLKSEISELEESMASVKRVLLENLFKPADENAEIDDNKLNMLYMRFINLYYDFVRFYGDEIDDNKLNMLYMRFINLYYDFVRFYGDTALDDDIKMILDDVNRVADLKKELTAKRSMYKAERDKIIKDVYSKLYGDLGIENQEGHIVASQVTDEIIKYVGEFSINKNRVLKLKKADS